ncbi:mandelate racemase/muconate lactonizing enzyme family protein [Natrarchaeobaculum sulfurireducens]|uniref:o-succinylbenzoate synthase n=1 Tax=Natrarchaeobaculum sulfurireducens TaxID=2044521 RepID=A0A346PF39_9EURY|nr:o-succinylbenzoate synthase [Natrarchaeobaculum sulfurireducens]AXR78134.1 L-alanine-DL-glutamate epimerase [Natrarchaeobaculum sulfurireducens]AXR81877.1 O-succinylbenzoate synthase [Natrarchaeobaculum sulfurireducens]
MTTSSTDELQLEYRPFSVRLERPLRTGHGSIESRDGFLVRVTEADDGGIDSPTGRPVGFGEATPLSGWTESYADCKGALEQAQAAFQAGGPEAALEAVDERSAARHGVTLALADFQARRTATPLYRYLGQGPMVARIPVNATIGDGTPADTAADAARAVADGFRCCKLKVGARSVSEDVERVRQVRDAVGPEVELRVDANESWTYDEAGTAIEHFADFEVSLLEQPLPAGALEGHATLRGNGVPIALDEGVLEHGVDAICRAGAADAVVLKPMALGGVDVARRVAAWVTELGVVPIVTTTIDAVVARTGAVHLAAAIPDVPACGVATGDLLAEDLARDPVLLENGSAVVPQTKGLGVEGVWTE